MDKIKLEDLKITVKILFIEGKKITKNFLQQIPVEICVYHIKKGTKYIGCGDNDYVINGSLICWYNFPPTNTFSQYYIVESWKGMAGHPNDNSIFHQGNLHFALFLNEKKQLRMTIIDKKTITRLELEQSYI